MCNRAFIILLGCLITNLAIGSELVEIGKGTLYWKRIIKVYDARLIAPANTTKKNILNDDVSKCLILNYRVSLDANKIITGANVVLQRQHSKEELVKISDELELLNKNMKSTKKGDQYQLCYDHMTKILRLEFNHKVQHESQSSELARFYLGIWLNENQPVSKNLRLSLLK